MCLVVHNSEHLPPRIWTPEEREIHRKIDKADGRLMLVVAILVFGSIVAAFIAVYLF
jgi:hypothetical protein